MVSANRRLTERLLKALNVWDAALAAGMVNESCYDPAAIQYAGRNLADAISLTFPNTSTLPICWRRRSRRSRRRSGSASCAARASPAFRSRAGRSGNAIRRRMRRGSSQRLVGAPPRRSADPPGSRARSRIPRSSPAATSMRRLRAPRVPAHRCRASPPRSPWPASLSSICATSSLAPHVAESSSSSAPRSSRSIRCDRSIRRRSW
jgi:hypothetical protein